MPRKKDKRPDWFKVFRVIRPMVKAVPAECAGKGFVAALDYFETGEEPENLDYLSKAIFESLRGYVDQAYIDYANIVERNTRNGKNNESSDTEANPAVPNGYNVNPVAPNSTQQHPRVTEEEVEEEVEEDKDDIEKGQRICTEPSKLDSMQQPSPTVFQLILKDGNTYGINEDEVDYYAAKYPAVDIEQAFRNMIGWLDANPGKRKTRQGMNAFITNWLMNAQDRGAKHSAGNQQPDRNQYDNRPQPQGNPFADVPDFEE